MMRILVLHPRHWVSSDAAKKLGVEVRHFSIGGESPHRLDGKISYDGIGEKTNYDIIKKLIEVFSEFKPDVFLFGIHFGLYRKYLIECKKVSPATKFVMHYTDQRNSLSRQVQEYLGILDLILITNNDPHDVARYKAVGLPIRTFYDGVDPLEYRPKPIIPEYDCYFGGNDFYGLEMILRKKNQGTEMLEKFTGAYFRSAFMMLVNERFRLIIRGQYGWSPNFGVKPMLFSPREIDGMLESKILLSTFNLKYHGLITRRILRCLASGRMLLTEYCPGMEEHFQNHEHLVWFNSADEGLDHIRYYLEHPIERNRIARSARKLVLKRHTFDRRLEEFVGLIKENFG